MSQTRFTHSSIRSLRTCPQKYRIEYEERVRPAYDAEPLRIGTAYHDARELDTQPLEHGIQSIRDAYRVPPAWCETPEQVDAWETESVIVQELYRGFRTHSRQDEFEILGSEVPFSIQIPGLKRVRNAGKIDKIVRLMDGRFAVLEIKTAGEDIAPASDYWRKLRMDSQITRYLIAAQGLGWAAETIVYDVTRKPDIRPKNIPGKEIDVILDFVGDAAATYHGYGASEADILSVGKEYARHRDAEGDVPKSKRKVPKIRETPGLFGLRLRRAIADDPTRYYQRIEIPRLQSDIDEFYERMKQDVAEVRFRRSANVWQKNDTACTQFGRCCFLELCANHVDVSIDVPEGFRRLDTPHPELEP